VASLRPEVQDPPSRSGRRRKGRSVREAELPDEYNGDDPDHSRERHRPNATTSAASLDGVMDPIELPIGVELQGPGGPFETIVELLIGTHD
jgi:hypothetical protein